MLIVSSELDGSTCFTTKKDEDKTISSGSKSGCSPTIHASKQLLCINIDFITMTDDRRWPCNRPHQVLDIIITNVHGLDALLRSTATC